MGDIQIFISYKFHDENGNVLPDYYMAKDLYERLTRAGLNVFFSDETIRKMGKSDYKRLIDTCLDDAEMLIVVSTDPDHCNSNWVRYEWDSFYNDLLSEQKKGLLISYLDTDDVRRFPRTIRTLQVYEKAKNGAEELVRFVKSYFHVCSSEPSEEKPTGGSSYNYNAVYELGDERKRLAIQGKVESCQDRMYIEQLLPPREAPYTVLDVGCSVGDVTKDVFSPFGDAVTVLGVDKFRHCVDSFNESAPPNMHAEWLNFDDPQWEEQLRAVMQQHAIAAFDLVYCALSLHHMADSRSVVKKLWKYMADGGHIYIRTCDDMLKIAYPEEEIIYEIIRKTAAVPRVSDRFHGRKVYSMLYKARYKNITMKPFLIDTANKDMDERHALFYSTFVWRKNYFKNRLDAAKTQEDIDSALKEYNEMVDLLDRIEDRFADSSFYFGYYVTIAIAEKSNRL